MRRDGAAAGSSDRLRFRGRQPLEGRGGAAVGRPPSKRRTGIHRHGKHFIGTGETDDGFDIELEGRIRSPVFTIDHDYLMFRAGAYGEGRKCVVQLHAARNNDRIKRAPVFSAPRMRTHIWDVRDYLDDKVYLRLIDRAGKNPCAIHIDYVRLVDG